MGSTQCFPAGLEEMATHQASIMAMIGPRRALKRLLSRPPLRLALPAHPSLRYVATSSTSAAPDFSSWLSQSSNSPVYSSSVAEYLGVADVDVSGLSVQERQEIISGSSFVSKIGSIARWCFLSHASAADDTERETVEAVFRELMPWGNMAKGDVWQHFYIRRFFLSGAPIEVFLALYEVHRSVLEASGTKFLDLPTSVLMREYCWRMRVDEAIDAYTKLDLSDAERRSFSVLLNDYEQFDALRRLYEIQDAMDEEQGREAPTLDPVFILRAFKELGESEELLDRFEALPSEEQSRAEIQELLADA